MGWLPAEFVPSLGGHAALVKEQDLGERITQTGARLVVGSRHGPGALTAIAVALVKRSDMTIDLYRDGSRFRD
jgi:hypothetical protein